jgi:hypothetical protein
MIYFTVSFLFNRTFANATNASLFQVGPMRLKTRSSGIPFAISDLFKYSFLLGIPKLKSSSPYAELEVTAMTFLFR